MSRFVNRINYRKTSNNEDEIESVKLGIRKARKEPVNTRYTSISKLHLHLAKLQKIVSRENVKMCNGK